MISRKKKYLMAVSALLAAAIMSGCGAAKTKTAGGSAGDLGEYPLNTTDELTYWFELGTNISTSYSNFGDSEFAKELEKRTGVKVKYIHPAQGQETEAFGIMVASDDMADIIKYRWTTALGGPGTAIKDNVIIPLNDYLDKYAPNYKREIESSKDIEKSVKTNDGDCYAFAPLTSGYVTAGPMIRKDWLDDLGLSIPKTVDEFENVLRQFKEKKGAEAAFSETSNLTVYLLNTLGTTETFYVDNGKIKYAPAEPEYKRALEKLAAWYKEGLLDQNYLSNDTTMLDANILNDNTGYTVASIGSGMGKWKTAMQGKDDKFNFVAMPYLTFAGEDKPNMINTPSKINKWSLVAVSSSCRNPELAAKFLDYGYSEEGHMLFNFGIEGKTYNMVDGQPKYTDEILKNPDGLTVNQAMGKYFAASGGCLSNFKEDVRYLEQYYQFDEQKEALDVWVSQMDSELESKTLPILCYDYDESEEYANIVTNLDKYRQEQTAAFISGARPLSEYDAFVSGLKDLQLDRAIEIVQSAYNKYTSK